MSRLVVFRLRLFIALTILVGLIGVLDGYLSPLDGDHDKFTAMYQNGVRHLLGGAMVWGFEIIFVQSRYGAYFRRLYFLTAIAIKSTIMIVMIFFVTLFVGAYFHGVVDSDFLFGKHFYRTLSHIFIFIVVIQTAIQIVRIIGARNLLYFVLGKYRRPTSENKIFMFLDLVGSMALTERLGDVGVQTMVTKFFFDITEPIIEYGGEIHRYVGDQVVVTWPLKTAVANLRAIRCCFAIDDQIRDKASEYQREFDTVPTYRIGLHGGPVVISQCGDHKQEISYFGDTVNTAARVEQQCKALNSSLLISGELLDKVDLASEFQALPKGQVQLRGRKSETILTQGGLEMVVQHRQPEPGFIHHTDRGATYAMQSYRDILDQYNLISSISRKRDCWDNAVAESFFSNLKNELVYWHHFNNRNEARSAIFDYIEVFYYRLQLHQTLSYISPDEYENQVNAS